MGPTHTPGPWTAVANSWQYTTIYDANEQPVCRLDLEDLGVDENNQDALERVQAETANLIAAAPEMLALLLKSNTGVDYAEWCAERDRLIARIV